MKKLHILILGSWLDEVAENFSKETKELGYLLFERGHIPIIAIAGRTGTMTDFILGVTDYAIPCAYLLGSSKNMDTLMELDGIKGKANVFVGDTTRSLLDFVENYH